MIVHNYYRWKSTDERLIINDYDIFRTDAIIICTNIMIANAIFDACAFQFKKVLTYCD